MKQKALIFIVLLLTTLINMPVSGQTDDNLNVIQTVVPFLTIAPDSRSGAMGDVGVATSPDVFSMHWNPSKFAFIDGNGGFGISYSPWLRALVPDINLAYITGYFRLDSKQVLAGSMMYSSLGVLEFTTTDGYPLRDFRPLELSLDASYSRLLSKHFSAGVALRFIYSNITGGTYVGETATKAGIAVAADASGFYTTDLNLGSKTGNLSAGINFSNIGSKMSYTNTRDPDFIPMNMKLGSTGTIDLDRYNSISLSLDLNKLLVPTPPIYDTDGVTIIDGKDPNVSVPVAIFQSFYDAPGGFSEEIKEFTISIGTEYWYNEQFALRAGYFHEAEMKGNKKYFTAGAGFRLSVFSLDFSYLVPVTQNNPLARTLRFSLAFDFDALRNVKK